MPARRPLGGRLARAVAREMLGPVVLACGALTTAALLKNVLGWADLVLNRGQAASAVLTIALHQVAPVLAQTLPLAVLIGLLVGLGRLRADSELLAVELAGIHPLRLLAPLLLLALPLAAGEALLTTGGVPAARRGLLEAFERVAALHPTATLRAGVPEDFGDRQLLAEEVSADGRRLRGVLIWMSELGQTVFAESARVEALGPDQARIEMRDALLLSEPGQRAQVLRVGRFETRLERRGGRHLELREEVGLEAISWSELRARARADADPQLRRRARAEMHQRLALPAAIPLFAALALALALGGPGGSRARGAATGLAVVVLYYGLVQLGHGLLGSPGVPVAAAVWLPDAVIAALAGVLLARRWRGAGIPRAAPRTLLRPRVARVGPMRRPLERYVLGLHTRLVLLSLAALTAAYLAIDVMERLDWFVRHGATFAEVLRFYAARIVLLIARVVPMSLLAGTALLVGLLEVRGELVAMRSLGIRLARGLAPALVAALLWTPVSFALGEWVLPRTNAWADRIKESEIKDRREPEAGTDLWYRVGEQLVHLERATPSADHIRDLTVYRLGPGGLPRARIDARAAHHLGGGLWKLEDGHRIEISAAGVASEASQDTLQLEVAEAGLRDTMHMGAWELAREIRQAEARGYDTRAYRVDWHRKLAAPLACLLLPALSLLQALSVRERRSVAAGLVASVLLGVGYLILRDVATALGYGGALAPALAGWLPPAALGLLAGLLVWRIQR